MTPLCKEIEPGSKPFQHVLFLARRPWKLGRLKVLLPKWLGMVVCWRLGTLETFGHFAHSTENKINIFFNHWWASHWFWVSLCLSRTSSGRWGHIWPHSISYHHILVINFFVSAKITQNPKIWIWAQKLTEWRRYIRKLNQNRNPFNFFSWRMLKDFCVWQGGWLRAGVTPQISFCRIQGLMDSFWRVWSLRFWISLAPLLDGLVFATQEAWEWWPEGRGSWGDWRFCCPSGLVWFCVAWCQSGEMIRIHMLMW